VPVIFGSRTEVDKLAAAYAARKLEAAAE
jgi:hypothetical protein